MRDALFRYTIALTFPTLCAASVCMRMFLALQSFEISWIGCRDPTYMPSHMAFSDILTRDNARDSHNAAGWHQCRAPLLECQSCTSLLECMMVTRTVWSVRAALTADGSTSPSPFTPTYITNASFTHCCPPTSQTPHSLHDPLH